MDTSVSTAPAKDYVLNLVFHAVVCGTTGKYPDKDGGSRLAATTVNGLSIFSLSAFDATHPALSLLNDYFLCDNDSISQKLSWHDLLRPEFTAGGLVGDTTGSGIQHFKLMVPPSILGYRQFVMNIRFKDSTQISDTVGVTLF